MNVYRVSYRDAAYEHKGYSYHTSIKDAGAAIRKAGRDVSSEIDAFKVKISKLGILDALRQFGSHPDNG